MNEQTGRYIRCRNCGKHIEENQSINRLYCSEICAGTFTRCPNCGKFFSSAEKERHSGFCSIECETLYNDDGIIISSKTMEDQN